MKHFAGFSTCAKPIFILNLRADILSSFTTKDTVTEFEIIFNVNEIESKLDINY